jgi:hypothetical protein
MWMEMQTFFRSTYLGRARLPQLREEVEVAVNISCSLKFNRLCTPGVSKENLLVLAIDWRGYVGD